MDLSQMEEDALIQFRTNHEKSVMASGGIGLLRIDFDALVADPEALAQLRAINADYR